MAHTLDRRAGRDDDGPALERRAAFGAPGTFTPERIRAIAALACEAPQVSDLPISHWSQSELARQARPQAAKR